jgi:hypothetical protein
MSGRGDADMTVSIWLRAGNTSRALGEVRHAGGPLLEEEDSTA